MKKKIILAGTILIIIGLISGAVYGYSQWKKARNEKIEQVILSIEYREQNTAFGMSINASELGYQGYDMIKEEELYIRLEVYNSWNKQQNNGREEVSLADIEDYLASEYNEDGELRVYSRPQKIQEYMKWYYEDGNGDVEEYWNELQTIALDCEREHAGFELQTVKNMTTEQLQELINKYNNPAYEINPEIMGGTE